MASVTNSNFDDQLRSLVLHHCVEQFYYAEAALLDTHEYSKWVEMFSDDTHYFMPIRRTRATHELDQEFTKHGEMAYFDDTKPLLVGRTKKLQSGRAWAESPPSRIRHLITNVRVTGDDGETLKVESNFYVYRTRLKSEVDSWVGRRDDKLRRVGDSFKIAARNIYLDQTLLLSPNMSSFF